MLTDIVKILEKYRVFQDDNTLGFQSTLLFSQRALHLILVTRFYT